MDNQDIEIQRTGRDIATIIYIKLIESVDKIASEAIQNWESFEKILEENHPTLIRKLIDLDHFVEDIDPYNKRYNWKFKVSDTEKPDLNKVD